EMILGGSDAWAQVTPGHRPTPRPQPGRRRPRPTRPGRRAAAPERGMSIPARPGRPRLPGTPPPAWAASPGLLIPIIDAPGMSPSSGRLPGVSMAEIMVMPGSASRTSTAGRAASQARAPGRLRAPYAFPSAQNNVVVGGVGGVAGVVLVVGDEGEDVGVSGGDGGGDLFPPGAERAGLGQHRRCGAGGVVFQRRGGPVPGHVV